MPTFAEVLAQQKEHYAAVVADLDAAEAERSTAAVAWQDDLLVAANSVAGARSRYDRAKDETARARAEEADARRARIDATAARDALLRDAYAAGATAKSLAAVAGISVPRVNQIVAGAR